MSTKNKNNNSNQDIEIETLDAESESTNKIMDFLTGAGGHILFGALVLIILAVVVNKFWNWGTVIKSDYDPNNIQDSNYIEVLDNIVPHDATGSPAAADGVTTIVTFGNTPFSDDRDSETGLANLIAKKENAVVYNCAVSGSYIASAKRSLQYSSSPMEAFGFYWLTTLFCVDNYEPIASRIDKITDPELQKECRTVVDTLHSLDFNTVDAIAIMYDGIDYYRAATEYDGEDYSNIQTTVGNLHAGIELIQETYPHIEIIVMSPTYSYYLSEDGEYLNSEQHYLARPLSSYAMIIERAAYLRGVTFIDNYFGSVNADNASQYLEDHYRLNESGRQVIADRFSYAFNYFK